MSGWHVGLAAAWAVVATGLQSPPPAADLARTELLTLARAQEIALGENPSLVSAGARIRRAEAELAQVKAASWPTIALRTSAAHNQLPERTVRDIEEALFPFDDDFQQQVEQVLDDNLSQIRRAGDAAQAALRAEQRRRLRNNPVLFELQEAIFDEQDRRADLIQDTLQRELSDLDPVGDLIEALGLDEPPTVDDRLTFYQAGAVGNWVLFDGFSRRFSRSAARYGQRISIESRRDAQRLLLGAVARAYYQAQLTREEVNIARADVDFNARLLNEARRRRQVGQASLSTELNFEVRRNLAETSMVNAERQHQASRVALAALLGYPEAVLPPELVLAPLEPERPEQLDPPAPSTSIGYALAHRPDVEFARMAVLRSESGVHLARSAYAPSISVTGNYGGFRRDNPAFDEDDLSGSVGVVLNLELFQGGRRRARVREALAVRDEAESELAETELSAASEVRGAIVGLRFAGRLLQLQRRNLALIERTRDLVELEFKAGRASLVRLNEAQRDLVQARSRLATALASLHVAWHDLQESTARNLAEY